eukprot:365028-Chlamydomonas_euryale.AAC.29
MTVMLCKRLTKQPTRPCKRLTKHPTRPCKRLTTHPTRPCKRLTTHPTRLCLRPAAGRLPHPDDDELEPPDAAVQPGLPRQRFGTLACAGPALVSRLTVDLRLPGCDCRALPCLWSADMRTGKRARAGTRPSSRRTQMATSRFASATSLTSRAHQRCSLRLLFLTATQTRRCSLRTHKPARGLNSASVSCVPNLPSPP